MRVLVVDDDVSVRFPLERALRKAGIETGSATSVRHAIDRLRNDDILDYKSKRAGGKMAMIISYTVLVITAYITITDMFGI